MQIFLLYQEVIGKIYTKNKTLPYSIVNRPKIPFRVSPLVNFERDSQSFNSTLTNLAKKEKKMEKRSFVFKNKLDKKYGKSCFKAVEDNFFMIPFYS